MPCNRDVSIVMAWPDSTSGASKSSILDGTREKKHMHCTFRCSLNEINLKDT